MANNADDVEDGYAKACYYIEKVLHIRITKDYPVATFLEQLYQINKDPNPFNLSFLGKPKSKGITLGA